MRNITKVKMEWKVIFFVIRDNLDDVEELAQTASYNIMETCMCIQDHLHEETKRYYNGILFTPEYFKVYDKISELNLAYKIYQIKSWCKFSEKEINEQLSYHAVDFIEKYCNLIISNT